MVSSILINPDLCTGCRSCEIACSFSFKKAHQPSGSKIKILFDAESGNMRISISDECNLCKGKEPLCVKYCAARALISQANEGG